MVASTRLSIPPDITRSGYCLPIATTSQPDGHLEGRHHVHADPLPVEIDDRGSIAVGVDLDEEVAAAVDLARLTLARSCW